MSFLNIFSHSGFNGPVEEAVRKLRVYRDPGEDYALFTSAPSSADLVVTDPRLDEYHRYIRVRQGVCGIILLWIYIGSWVVICCMYYDGMTRPEQLAIGTGFGLAGISIYMITLSTKWNTGYYVECLNKEIEHLNSSLC